MTTEFAMMEGNGVDWALVTGAGRGIGKEISLQLAREGMNVVMVDLGGLADTVCEVEEVGVKAVPVEVDLSLLEAPAKLKAVMDDTLDRSRGRLRAVVNNAGITRDARLINMEEENFIKVVEVNLGAAYRLTSALIDMIAEGGSIVNMASRAYLGNFGQFNYSVSKGGLVGLTRAWALSLAPQIRVNAVAPGLVGTEMVMAIPDEIRNKMVSSIPLGRMAEPCEIANLVSFLISDQSSYITGQVLIAGGGRSLSR